CLRRGRLLLGHLLGVGCRLGLLLGEAIRLVGVGLTAFHLTSELIECLRRLLHPLLRFRRGGVVLRRLLRLLRGLLGLRLALRSFGGLQRLGIARHLLLLLRQLLLLIRRGLRVVGGAGRVLGEFLLLLGQLTRLLVGRLLACKGLFQPVKLPFRFFLR